MATTILDTFVTLFTYKVEGLDKVEKAAKRAVDVGKTLTHRVTAPIIAGFTGMVFAASKFEDGLDNVLNLLTSDEIEKYRKQLSELQKETVKNGFALDDTNKALFDNVSALGVSEAQMKAFEIAQRLAIGGNASLSTSIVGLNAVINAYGKETTDAVEVANAFFSSQRFGTTTVEELAANVGKVAPIAKTAGIGFQDLLATMAELTQGGLSTDEAATALRGALNGLLNPSSDAADAMEEIGLPIGATALRAESLTTILLKLAKAAKENPDVVATMFPNIRAQTAIASLDENSMAHLHSTLVQMNKDFKEGTGLNEAYARSSNNSAHETKKMWGQLQVSAMVLGKHLLPVFLKIIDKINGFFEALEKMSPEGQRFILTTLAILAAIGPLILILGRLVQAVALVRTAILAIQAVAAVGGFAALLNPVGLIIAAIGLLVAWFTSAYLQAGNLGDAFKIMGAQLIGFGDRLMKFVLYPINIVIDSIQMLIGLLAKIPGFKWLNKLNAGIGAVQGNMNLSFTGSSSRNPFASREVHVPFDPRVRTAIEPAALSSGGGRSMNDNRQFHVKADVQVNEATDGAAIAETFAKELGSATRTASDNFQSVEK